MRLLTILIFILWGSLAVAQNPWGLEKILQRASEQTPLLQALDQQVIAAEELSKQAGRWDNPDVGFSKGPYWEREVKGDATAASISQSIPLFGQKHLAAKIGEKQAMVIKSERDLERLRILHEIVRLSYSLSTVLEQEKHTLHRRSRLNLITKFLSSRPFASPAQMVEKNLIENRMRDIEAKFVDITLQKEKIWQDLNVYLALEKMITPDLHWFKKPKLPDSQALSTTLLQNNPELMRQSHLVESSLLVQKRMNRMAYPEVRLGASYYRQDVGDNLEKSYTGMIDVSVPIWNRGQNASRSAAATAQAEKYKLDHQKRRVHSDFQKEWAHLLEVQKKIELYPLGLVETLEKQMDRTERNWKKGLVTAIAFLELENQVHDQTDRVFDMQAEYVHALSQVLYLAGQNFHVEDQQ